MGRIPEGVWSKCPECSELIFIKDLIRNLRVCPRCGFHFPMSAEERISLLLTKGSFRSLLDPRDGLMIGTGRMRGVELAVGAIDTEANRLEEGEVYESIAALFNHAAQNRLPVIVISPGGLFMGGERDERALEGIAAMEKGLIKLGKAGLLYLSILTDPHPVYDFANYIPLGDIVLAEPRGRTDRLRRENPVEIYSRPSPDKLIDRIVERGELKRTVWRIIKWCTREGKNGRAEAEEAQNG